MSEATVGEVYHRLEAGGFRCELTGWPINPDNFSLDHIVPASEGGSDDIDNLQCVHPIVNTAKGTTSQKDFVNMCNAVAKHQKQKSGREGHGGHALRVLFDGPVETR